ncbi:class I SAM-dependent methyltransferase [Candidatus Thorarchaeota archaeon]|nr:MAG: class I SAM-dependent methyltransferase [Candidatus Thorarchaeota archaeon]
MYGREVFSANAYKFLYYIRHLTGGRNVEKSVLDCGAGGPRPPLAVFHFYGFKTYGIEVSMEMIAEADSFCKRNGINLNIKQGDMRQLPFGDESFGYVYSQNSIFHLTKADTTRAMSEMKRVLKTEGLLYVNFLSTDDQGFGEGEAVGPGEWRSMEHGEPTVHSYYEPSEPDKYFEDMDILVKEFVVSDRRAVGYRMATIEYVAKNG